MEHYTKQEIMNLPKEELLKYVNHMLLNGYSLSKLERKKLIVRKTVGNRLNSIGYFYNDELNQYVAVGEKDTVYNGIITQIDEPQEPKKAKKKTTLEELEKRVEALEKRLNGTSETPINQNAKVMQFKSKPQDRNYPLHPEVIELLDELKNANTHLKVKDLVNTALYIGLTELKQQDS